MIVGIAAGVICVACLLNIVLTLFGGGGGEKPPLILGSYYYDTGTKKLIVVDGMNPENIPPIKGLGGKDAFRAHVFACGQCTEQEMIVGWIEGYTPEARELKLDFDRRSKAGEKILLDKNYYETMERGLVISDVKEKNWVPFGSAAADAIREKIGNKKCPGGTKLKTCHPTAD